MAIYPIKMLKDEQGQPFVPLTHISAVSGEEYTTTVLNAVKQSAGHYKITNSDLTTSLITNKVIAVRFDDVTGATSPSYLKINNDAEHILYQSDGTNYLNLTGFDTAVAFFTYKNSKFQLLEVGATASNAGHTITDTAGNVMTNRSVLNFKYLDVSDQPGLGATQVSNPNYTFVRSGISGATVTGAAWTPVLASGQTITTDVAGYYRVTVALELNNIATVGREIGMRVGNNEVWDYQYKRFKKNMSIIIYANANASIAPEIYVDKLTSTDTITASASIFVERLYQKS
jgi:hypothetical protein